MSPFLVTFIYTFQFIKLKFYFVGQSYGYRIEIRCSQRTALETINA